LKKIKTVANKVVKTLEAKLTTNTKLLAASLGLAAIATSAILLTPKSNDIVQSAVKITNLAGNSGGSGVVIQSSDVESTVLSNAHVCQVVVNGGQVWGHNGSFIVKSYKLSNLHDLCLIKVNGNLKASTTVATRSPVSYYEKATISGHPQLLPNVVTSGHFSGQMVVSVLTGIRECTDQDMSSPEGALICFFFQGMPVIKNYQSTLVTATIMPGSSGSGVYNEDNELTGLAFAGSGELGYAWTVPHSYLVQFLEQEQHTVTELIPNAEQSLLEAQGVKRIKQRCRSDFDNSFNQICNMVRTDIIINGKN
jgi:hypothetical protein